MVGRRRLHGHGDDGGIIEDGERDCFGWIGSACNVGGEVVVVNGSRIVLLMISISIKIF